MTEQSSEGGLESMKYVVKPIGKYVLGFCNVCKENCYNDCGTQVGCTQLVTCGTKQ